MAKFHLPPGMIANGLAADMSRRERRLVFAMAFDRHTFQNRCEGILRGALGEHYKAQLAEKCGLMDYVNHWRKEVEQHISQSLYVTLRTAIRGFKDRRKALNEVIIRVRADDISTRRWATRVVMNDFRRTSLPQKLDDEDTEKFWTYVETWVQDGLQP